MVRSKSLRITVGAPDPGVVPDLTLFDIILVSTSAGKDSQAMLDYVVELAEAAGVRERVLVVHADLGRVEWKGTKNLAEEQADHYDLRFEVVSRPQGDLLTHIEKRGMFPGPSTRYCTSDHKRGQISKLFTQLSREAGRHVRILNCMGMRAEESPVRAKLDIFKNDKRNSNSKRTVDTWLPIHTWKVEKVWDRIRKSGVRHHFAYDLGMPRLSCVFCIFAPREALALAASHNRELLDEYVAVEKRTGHTFKQDFSLASLRDDLDAGQEIKQVADWKM